MKAVIADKMAYTLDKDKKGCVAPSLLARAGVGPRSGTAHRTRHGALTAPADPRATSARRRYAWEYDHAETMDVAKEISQECMTKVKELMGESPRYKLIFHVRDAPCASTRGPRRQGSACDGMQSVTGLRVGHRQHTGLPAGLGLGLGLAPCVPRLRRVVSPLAPSPRWPSPRTSASRFGLRRAACGTRSMTTVQRQNGVILG